jgi:bifunctional DNase/RNase
MADMVRVTITGVVRGAEDEGGAPRRERFFMELTAAAARDARRLRIGVGDAEATALAFSLQGTEFPRPMTYQFTAALLTAAGSGVRLVRVTGVTDGVYYAQVVLRGGATVDARPSDALNLAAITGAPVEVAADLLSVPADVGQSASLSVPGAAFEERRHPVILVLAGEQQCLGGGVEVGGGRAMRPERQLGELKRAPGLPADLPGEGDGRR